MGFGAGLDVVEQSLLPVPEFEPRTVQSRGLDDVRSNERRKFVFCCCVRSLHCTQLTVCVFVWSYWSFLQAQQAGKSLGLVLEKIDMVSVSDLYSVITHSYM